MATGNSRKELSFAIGATALSAILAAQSFRYAAESSAFPRFLSLLMLAFSLAMLVRSVRAAKSEQRSEARLMPGMAELKAPVGVFGGTVAYIIGMHYIGYFTATAIFLLSCVLW